MVHRWSLFALAALVACGGEAAPDEPKPEQPIDPVHAALQLELDAKVTELGVPGATLAIVSDDISWLGASGLADVTAQHPIEFDALLGIGSVTKTFTAAVIVQLRDEGMLTLDDAVAEHCASCPFGELTIEQLLRHTSGLDDFLLYMTVGELGQAWSPLELVALATQGPSGQFSYSNTNYMLLGVIVEQVSGNTWEHEVRTRLLDPLALDGTFLPSVDEVPQVALGYTYSSEATDLFHPSVGWAMGSMISTAGDMVRWMQALTRGEVVATVAEMTTTTAATPVYGLGLYVFGDKIGHDGDAVMYRSSVFCRRDACVAAITNTSPSDVEQIADVAWDVQ